MNLDPPLQKKFWHTHRNMDWLKELLKEMELVTGMILEVGNDENEIVDEYDHDDLPWQLWNNT